jgi:hypothetical protein
MKRGCRKPGVEQSRRDINSIAMKKFWILALSLLGLFGSCKKDQAPEVINRTSNKTNSNGLVNLLTIDNTAGNYLAFDQSFIDFVYHSINNLAAGEYINSKLGNRSSSFINNLKQCNDNACIVLTVNQYQLSVDTLDDYFYSAIGSALIFRANHPEFDNMDEIQRSSIFQQAFISGMNSGDSRWQIVKANINAILQYYYSIELYKASGDWNDYVGCFLNEIKGVFIGALQLGTIVEAIKTGNVAKGLKALKSFLKSTVGRTLTWVGLAILAWDIFDCCWDVSHSGNGDTSFGNGETIKTRSFLYVGFYPYKDINLSYAV